MIKTIIFGISLIFTAVAPLTASTLPDEKVALLFLTREELNHPRLWQELLEDCPDRFSVYIHSMAPLQDTFFAPYRIPQIVPTTWSIHAKAWQILLQEALKDPENQRFVFLSESCIPLYRLGEIYDVLIDDPRSHMAFARPWWQKTSRRELQEVEEEFRFGNNEWMILNRRHAEIIAQDNMLIRIASRHSNDQESYFASLLAIHDCLHEVCNHSFTYVNWKNATNKGASPWCFEEPSAFNDGLLDTAYTRSALFARKFAKTYPEDVLLNMIMDNSN